jgi:hypothetical protein
VGLKQDSELSSLDKTKGQRHLERPRSRYKCSFKNSKHKNESKSPISWVGRQVTKRRKRNRRKSYENICEYNAEE